MIVDPTPSRPLVTFIVAGGVIVGTLAAAAMALGMLAFL